MDGSVASSVTPHHTTVCDTCHTWTVLLPHLSRLITQQSAIPAHMDGSVASSVTPHHTTVCDTCHTWTVLLPHLSRLITQQSVIPATHGRFCCLICHASSHNSLRYLPTWTVLLPHLSRLITQQSVIPATHGQFCCPICHASSHNSLQYLPLMDGSVAPSVTPHHTTVCNTCYTWTVLLPHLSRLITQQSAIPATHGQFCCPICHASSHNSLQYLLHMDSSVAPSVTPHHTTVCNTCHSWTVLLPHLSRLITQQSAIPATHGQFCCPICHASSHNSLQYLPHMDSSVAPSVTPHHTTVCNTCHTWTVLLPHLSRLITQQSAILATHGRFCCPICHASSHNSLQYLPLMDGSVAPSVTPHHTTVCNTCHSWTVLLPHLSRLITQQSAIPATHGRFCCPICHASSHNSLQYLPHMDGFCCPICHASSHNSLQYLPHMDGSVAPSVMPHHSTLMPNEFLLISYIQIESRFIGNKERWVNDSLPLDVSPGPLYVMSSMSRSWDRSFIGLACVNLSLQMSDSFQVNGAADSKQMSF